MRTHRFLYTNEVTTPDVRTYPQGCAYSDKYCGLVRRLLAPGEAALLTVSLPRESSRMMLHSVSPRPNFRLVTITDTHAVAIMSWVIPYGINVQYSVSQWRRISYQVMVGAQGAVSPNRIPYLTISKSHSVPAKSLRDGDQDSSMGPLQDLLW